MSYNVDSRFNYVRSSGSLSGSLNGARRQTLPISTLATNSSSIPSIPFPPGSNVDPLLSNTLHGEFMAPESLAPDKVKMKLMSMWNNMKYGWSVVKVKAGNINYNSEIWMLGVSYLGDGKFERTGPTYNVHQRPMVRHSSLSKESREADLLEARRREAIENFKRDFYSRIYMSYRREFPRIAGTQLTTDCGWGCMIRSGQMLLAQTFLFHFLGRNWRWSGAQSDKEDMIHRMIVKWFGDEPLESCAPFSVHQFIRIAQGMGKKAGDWFGPASVAHILKAALEKATPDNPLFDDICVYVASDCTVYYQDVVDLCTAPSKRRISLNRDPNLQRRSSQFQDLSGSSGIEIGKEAHSYNFNPPTADTHGRKSSWNNYSTRASSTINLIDSNNYFNGIGMNGNRSGIPQQRTSRSSSLDSGKTEKWRGVLIIIPVRLGGDKMNSIYIECVKNVLRHPCCVGIIGGKPKHSVYFVGYQDDKLIYLDPHYCQDAVDVKQNDFSVLSYHCLYPHRMPFTRMDPSCAFGFYLRTRDELNKFKSTIRSLVVPKNQKAEYPIFLVQDGKASPVDEMPEGYLPIDESYLRVRHQYVDDSGRIMREVDGEEFVMFS